MSAAGVDPQIFDDVVSAVLPIPGKDARRGYVVQWFVRGVGLKENCGGSPAKNKFSMRMDQAHYPDLDLIREQGFTGGVGQTNEADNRDNFGPNPTACKDLVPKSVPSVVKADAVYAAWNDMVLGLDANELAPALARVGDCLGQVVGVTVPKPVIDFYLTEHVDGAQERNLERLTDGYLTCTEPYFDQLRARLLKERPKWIERNRELLTAYSSEISSAGYVP